MLNSVLNRNFVLACTADCPADNQARQLALFLYETLPSIMKKILLILILIFSNSTICSNTIELIAYVSFPKNRTVTNSSLLILNINCNYEKKQIHRPKTLQGRKTVY